MKKHFVSCVLAFCVALCFSEAQQCGKRIGSTPMIFSGEKTSRAEWPWNVALIRKPSNTFYCSGTLVSAKHVLSVAHAFQGKGFSQVLQAQQATALIGKFNLEIDDEAGSISSPIGDIVIHPDWDFTSEKYDADIAIVILEDSVTFGEFIQPICLPPFSNDSVSGNGIVVGWGKSENTGLGRHHDTTPSMLVVPAIDASYCYPRYPPLGMVASYRMFCGGYEDAGKAPCRGDSGAGFYVLNSGTDRFWTIRGIVSSSLIEPSYGCDINMFSLYTNVAMFSDWIGKVLRETMAVEWKFVEFHCEYRDPGLECSTSYDGPVTRNVMIRPVFSSSRSVDDVKVFWIAFDPLRFIPAGVGKALPKMEILSIGAETIEAIQRLDFVDMKQLKVLRIIGSLIEFCPEDLLADLPNLEVLFIIRSKVGKFPDNFIANQKELKELNLSANKLTVLQKDLLKNNLKLETIFLYDNKLKEIAVDFTKFTGIRIINLQRNECMDSWWSNGDEQKIHNWDESIESFQDLINRNCTKT